MVISSFHFAKNILYAICGFNQCLIQFSLSQSCTESELANLSEKCCVQNYLYIGRLPRSLFTSNLQSKHLKSLSFVVIFPERQHKHPLDVLYMVTSPTSSPY